MDFLINQVQLMCLLIIAGFFARVEVLAAKKDQCEVCVGFVNQLLTHLESVNVPRTDEINVEEEVKSFCQNLRGKEAQLVYSDWTVGHLYVAHYSLSDHESLICYFIGASETSATYIIRELTGPLARYLPPEKVCEKLKAKDNQICELTYEKQIDWSTVDFNKLKVKDLKKVLDDWGEVCKGCTEKSEFIKQIKDLMPKYVKTEL